MSSPYSPRRLDDLQNLKKKLQSEVNATKSMMRGDLQAAPKLMVRSSSTSSSSSSRRSHENSAEGNNSPIKRSSSESKLGPTDFLDHDKNTIPRGVTFHEDIQLNRNIEKDRQIKAQIATLQKELLRAQTQVLELRNQTFESNEITKRNNDLIDGQMREVDQLEQLLLYVIDELSLTKGDSEKSAIFLAKQHEDYLSTVFHLNDVIKKGKLDTEKLEERIGKNLIIYASPLCSSGYTHYPSYWYNPFLFY